MVILEKVLPRKHKLFLAGDLHEGSILQHSHGIQQLIDSVKRNKNNFLVLMGDLCEGICVDDKRYDRNTESPNTPMPLLQYQYLTKLFKPISKQIILCLEGNHDWKIANRFGNCVRDIFCKELNVPYGTQSSKLSIIDNKNALQYKAFVMHYAKNISSMADDPIRREANMQLALKRRLNRKASDTSLMCVGHSHKLIVASPTKDLCLIDDGVHIKQTYTSTPQTATYIPPDLRWYVNTGSFLKLYTMNESGYAERAGYDPVELGYAVAHVEDGLIQNVEKVILD